MKIDFAQPLTDLDGKSLKDGEETVTLAKISVNALLAAREDKQVSGEEKMKRFALAEKIHKGADEVTVEEVALIKKLVGEVYSTLVVGRAYQLLEA